MGWPRRGDGYYTSERNNGGGRLPPWEEIPIPKGLGDSFPVCDKATRLGVWVCPLTQWRIFPLCWMTQLKIPSFICYNSLWFSPTLFWGLTTPVQCCASMTGEKRPALCSQPSVEDFAEGAVSIQRVSVSGFQAAFFRRGGKLLPAPGSQFSISVSSAGLNFVFRIINLETFSVLAKSHKGSGKDGPPPSPICL